MMLSTVSRNPCAMAMTGTDRRVSTSRLRRIGRLLGLGAGLSGAVGVCLDLLRLVSSGYLGCTTRITLPVTSTTSIGRRPTAFPRSVLWTARLAPGAAAVVAVDRSEA